MSIMLLLYVYAGIFDTGLDKKKSPFKQSSKDRYCERENQRMVDIKFFMATKEIVANYILYVINTRYLFIFFGC